MPCKYFTLLLFMFILKLQLLKLKYSQIWLWKQPSKSGYQNSSVWNVRQGKQIYEVLLQTLYGLQCPRPSCCCCLPPLGVAALTQRASSGYDTARSLSAASICILSDFTHILLKKVPSHNENFYSGIWFLSKFLGGSQTFRPSWTSHPCIVLNK